MKSFCINKIRYRFLLSLFVATVFITVVHNSVFAQCPSNVDFEDGTFTGWTCYNGNVSAPGGVTKINLSPSAGAQFGRHTMLSAVPGNGNDPFGWPCNYNHLWIILHTRIPLQIL